MTSREKSLVTIALFGVAPGILFVAYAFVYAPLSDAWTRHATASEELAKTQTELSQQNSANEAVLKLHPRLTQWAKLSLPPADPAMKKSGVNAADRKQLHVSQLKVEYERHLSNLLRNSGLRPETVKVSEKQENKVGKAPTPAKGMPPLYERLTFGATGVGPQEAVYRALKELQGMNVLHEVRSLKVGVPAAKGKEKPDPKTLELDVVVEALVVTGAEERTGVLPKALAFAPKLLAEPARDYNVLSKRSLFTGLAEPPPPPKEVVKTLPKVDTEEEVPKISERERLEALEFVKVTMLAYNPNRTRWEASLYDQAQGEGAEIKLDMRLFKTFTIYLGEKAVVEGKVAWIDEEQLIFASEGKHYRARVGEFLDAAWKAPLSAAEVKKLGL